MSNVNWEVGEWYTLGVRRAQVTHVHGDRAQVTVRNAVGTWVVEQWGADVWPHVRLEQWGACDNCDNLYVLGSDDHDGEQGLCWECA